MSDELKDSGRGAERSTGMNREAGVVRSIANSASWRPSAVFSPTVLLLACLQEGMAACLSLAPISDNEIAEPSKLPRSMWQAPS